jgi:lipopolysaccharide/colanic/teichoic acid biosynthesis glycosyltransferase
MYRGKRAFDLVVLAVVAVPAAIVGAACAVAIKLTSRGPVFFTQERVGLHGEPFTVFKFRTMVHADDNPLFPDASRITTVGRWLRRLSLDELPQLINVGQGSMSIVGPRPTLPYQVARYDDRQRRRLDVKPGLSGLAQIRGRNAIAWAERIDHDLEYVERQSPRLDVAILLRTAGAILSGAGVGGHPTDDALAAPPPNPGTDTTNQ